MHIKRFKSLGLPLLISLFFLTGLNAQVLNPVTWTFNATKVADNTYLLEYRADIEKNWNVYSQYTSDDGPVPTYIEYESKDGASLVGESIEIGHKKEGFDKLFDTNVIKFLDDKPFIIRQKVSAPEPGTISGYLTFMTCDQTRCLPPKDVDFSFDLAALSNASEKTNSVKKDKALPVSKPETKTTTTVPAETFKPEAKAKVNSTETVAKKTRSVSLKPGEQKVLKKASPAVQAVADNSSEIRQEKSKLEKPVIWKLSMKEVDADTYKLIYTAEIDDDWNVYSQHTSDDGPVATYIEYEALNGARLQGESVETGHRKEGPDPLFDNVNVIKFLGDQDYVITQEIKKGTGPIKGYLDFMACDASHCIPPSAVEFEFDPSTGYAGPKRPEAAASAIGINLDGNQLDQEITSLIESHKEPIAECGTQISDADANYWKIFIGGFLGGLVAILLPCIFPMIPITVSFFTKDNNTPGWVNGLIYGLSIVGIFVGLGLSVTAILGPTALNELSTNWIANVIFFIIFIAFAISFFGYFEITLPSSWSTKTDQMADKGGLIGTFFMAATLAIVSFSCTGPIIGSALVQVADNALGPFFIMLGFSIALAIPFGLFAAFPSWLNSLPRSGSWMTSVKVVLGFLELALALKFLSVADMTSGWGILKYELFMGLWVVIFAAMTLYLLGYIKFPHDSPIKKLGNTRKIFAGLSFVWMLYMASGFIIDKDNNAYTIPKAVSGITPPASYNFFLEANALDPTIKKQYASYTKCANDINCFKDYYEGLAYANEVNKPVLLDFTGYGCVNCRKTEDYIWKDPAIKAKLNNDFILVSLYVDDRKKLPQTLISKTREVKLRNVGNQWADFQIVNFQQNSQPLYVPITPDQKVITAPRGYEEGIDNYKDFLDCSLNAFRETE